MSKRFIAMILVAWLAPACGDDPDDPAAGDGGAGGDGGSAQDASGSSGEPAELMGMTAAHNAVRDEVGVPHVTWDPALAAIAQAWADQCIDNEAPAGLIDHNSGRSDNYDGYVGENVYGSSGNATAQDAMSSWASEKADYDYASNSCAQGEVCGHYTQLVWRDTSKIGCALANCAGLRFGSTIVCDYAPGGNTGGRPY